MNAPLFLTDRDVATALGKSAEFVRDQCRARKWPHLMVGRSYRFTEQHVAQIAELLEVSPSQERVAANSWGRRKRGM